MLFNSIDFAIFLPIVFSVYWLIGSKNVKAQNLFIILASYFFYAWWDTRFLALIILSSFVDFFIGLGLCNSNLQRRGKIRLLFISLFFNIGILVFFKYYNFFLDNFISAFVLFGKDIDYNSIEIILPVGISFYTFQTLSYSIDVYSKKIRPNKDLIAFLAFVSFFPQLVAGPIERAKNLLPQFIRKRAFTYEKGIEGFKQIIWGGFKKMVIADNCAIYVDLIFSSPVDYSGSTLVIGAVLFSFQIYADFSGYSDIAIGTGKLFGFQLKQNFAYPYFSRDVSEFWRRWHISLSSWFKDYVYIPLGGSRVRQAITIRNILIVFIISGFWHGASWNFIFWGLLNAILILPAILKGTNRKYIKSINENKQLPNISEFLKIFKTFSLVTFTFIFFRTENLSDAFIYLKIIFSNTLFELPYFLGMRQALILIILIGFLLLIEWLGRDSEYAIKKLFKKHHIIIQWVFYFFIVIIILLYGTNNSNFIYFQF